MFDLIDKHDPIRDCDCPYCAIVERNRLRRLIDDAPLAEIWESSLGVNGTARYLRVDPKVRIKCGKRVRLVVDSDD